jgi:hypothetical protein
MSSSQAISRYWRGSLVLVWLMAVAGAVRSGRGNGWRDWGGIGYNHGLALVCWLRLSGSAGKLQ